MAADRRAVGTTNPKAVLLRRDIRFSRVVVIATAVFALGFGVSDYSLYGPSPMFAALLATRGIFFLVALAVFRRLPSVTERPALERLVFGFAVAMVVTLVVVNYSRPQTYIAHAVIDVLVVVMLYWVVRLPLALQTLLAGVLTTANLVLFLGFKSEASVLPMFAVVAAYAGANILGRLASREFSASRSGLAEALRREFDAREQLTIALHELKNLERIFPVCSSCRRIRDENGSWHRAEVFVERQNEQDVEPELCPTCSPEVSPTH